MKPSARAHLAIALVSFAVLFYQVAITRVLSVVLWYHFAFLSISLALLGIGAPGVWLALRKRGAEARGLGAVLLAAGAAVPLSVVAIVKGPALFAGGAGATGGEALSDTAGRFLDAPVLATVAIVLVPFLLLGAAVCLLLLRAPGRKVGPMYAADLLGATLGAVVVVPSMHGIATPLLIAGCGLLPLIAAALVTDRRGIAAGAGAIAAALIVAVAWGEPFHLRHTKKYVETGDVLWEKWTPTGRLAVFPDVFHRPDPGEAFAWGMGSRWRPRAIEQLWIEQDGSAGTPITRRSGDPQDLAHLLYDVTSVAYQMRPARTVCVIGAGGGRDVLTALMTGATKVDAVELNPHTVGAVSGPFRELSGDVYGMPGVTPVISEGRSFLTRTDTRYDLIQISMVDSWAATSAGAFALSENYLYTVEAFRLYWNRLSGTGMASVSRWMMAQHLVEGVRLVLLAQEALRQEGVTEPARHLAVVQGAAVATLMMSRSPFTDADRAALGRASAERGFVPHWPPGEATPQGSSLARLLAEGGDGSSFAERGLDVSPPTDDRPFFFQAVPILGNVDPALVARLSVNEQSVILLRRLVMVVAALALALFLLPFAFGGRIRAPELWKGSGYFTAIGLAFLLVEAAWVQRFILYLGHPSYATTVVLAALLAGAGAGSFTARRTAVRTAANWAIALPVALAIVNAALDPVFQATLGAAFPARVGVSLLLLAPSGFLMGFGFPMGMIRFGDEAKAWYWALNGAFSVLASVLSLAAAMAVGFTAVAYAGAGCYVGAVLLFRWGPAARS
jgi:hypothetical protein